MTEEAQPARTEGHAARVVARNAAVRTVGEVIAKIASLVFFIATARVLGETGFGDLTFAISFTTVLFMISGFGTEELLTREVARSRGRVHEYLSNVVALKAALSVVVAALGVAIMLIADYSAEVRTAVYLIGIGICLENFGRTWGSVFQAYERMEFISLTLILQRILTAVAGVTALALGGRLIAVSAVYAVCALLGFLFGAWALRRYVVAPKWAVDRSRWWPIAKAGVPIGILALVSMTLLKLDQVLLSFLSGGDNREVGIYGAAFRLIEATLFISWSFSAAFLPWLSRQEGASRERIAGGFSLGEKALTAVLLPVAVVFVLLARPLIDLIYGSDYLDAVPSLQLLGAMTVFFGINGFAAIALIARDRPFSYTRVLLVATVLNIVTNVILIPPLGATGAALAALASGVLLAVTALVVLRIELGPIKLVRSFAGPVVAGALMAALIWGTGQHLVVGVVVGGAVYLLALVVFERTVFREDFDVFARLLHRRSGGPGAVPEGA